MVPDFIANLPVGYQNVMGGTATLGLPGGDKATHRGTFVYAVAEQKKWFDQMPAK